MALWFFVMKHSHTYIAPSVLQLMSVILFSFFCFTGQLTAEGGREIRMMEEKGDNDIQQRYVVRFKSDLQYMGVNPKPTWPPERPSSYLK